MGGKFASGAGTPATAITFATVMTLTVSALTTTIGTARADEFVPALVYDMGGKYDRSFNEAAYRGAERFKEETGVAFREFEVTNPAQREQALRALARRGATVIAGISFAQAAPMEKVSQEFPDVRFCLIDAAVDRPNVRSYTFRGHEGAFLVGMLAALASKTGTVGFVGGMDIPIVRDYLGGYTQGAAHAKPGTGVLSNMTGSTPDAWKDPAKGAELARGQFDRGVDVVFAAAGTTGLGVLQAAADAGKLGIGVDSNQNWMHPGNMLTSMLKRVDLAVLDCWRAAHDGSFKGGHQVWGVKEGALDWVVDGNNRALITPEMEAAVNEAKAEIAVGALLVKAYVP